MSNENKQSRTEKPEVSEADESPKERADRLEETFQQAARDGTLAE